MAPHILGAQPTQNRGHWHIWSSLKASFWTSAGDSNELEGYGEGNGNLNDGLSFIAVSIVLGDNGNDAWWDLPAGQHSLGQIWTK